jgi:predicted Zn-ribbon and HTH transcriptional regulator
MIIEALVRIELKSDGTWEILDLKSVSDTKLPEEQPQKRKKPSVRDHFDNLDRVRKKRRTDLDRKPHHCSDCGKAHHNKLTHPYH